MIHGEKLAEGKTKVVFKHATKKDLVVLFFKDDITAGDGAKHDVLPGKGYCDWETTRNCFELLNSKGVKTHYVSAPEENFIVVRKMAMIPLECVTRRLATGSLLKRLPFKEGTRFDPPLFELFLKDDALHDPFINDDQALALKTASQKELNDIKSASLKVFGVLEEAFRKQQVTLVDLKLEFGRSPEGLLVGDDVTNNSWRIWPKGRKELMLDKQLYREGHNLHKVLDGFQKAAKMTEKFLKK